jgi:hypothetical protein
MKRCQALPLFLSFIAGVSAAIVAPRVASAAANRWLFPLQYEEISRVTSPDGAVDAVMERSNCGAPCSFGYSVSVVAKNGAAIRDPLQQVFIADDMVNAQIRWNEPHLLSVSYDKARIYSFSNVAYPFRESGNWRDPVEIHLVPSSARFSYLADAR